jgi:hypothetical protein
MPCAAIGPGSLFGLVTFSHKIGLYDVQGPIPVVKHIMIPADMDGRIPVDLEMAMPLSSFLAPVESNKEHIAAALETLKPTSSWERATAAGQGIEGVTMGGRGFGVAMDALIKYLGTEHGVTFAMARVFAFLSGPPDYGAGQLDTRRYGEQYASKRIDADKALLPEQTPFYKDLVGHTGTFDGVWPKLVHRLWRGTVILKMLKIKIVLYIVCPAYSGWGVCGMAQAANAAESGVCVDLFVITNEYTDLASLKYLSIESGGSLILYSNTDEATLPQDLYVDFQQAFSHDNPSCAYVVLITEIEYCVL